MSGSADTQGMSQAEIELMDEMDGDGLPKETDTERENARVLALDSKGLPVDESDDTTDGPVVAATPAAAPPPPAPAPPPNEPAAAAPPPPAEPPASAEPPAAAPAEPEAAAFVPTYRVEVPADADAQIATLTAEKDAAFTKLMDGDADMSAETYQEIAKRTDEAVGALKEQLLTAKVLETANMQQAENEWKRQETRLMSEFKAEGLDYKGKPALRAAYNTHLKELAADEANESKDAAWYLNEAHRRTKADIGIATPAAAPAATPPAAPPAKPAPKSRGVDMTQIPPTLSNVPPALDPSVAGDEFAHMASLTGLEYEKAYAKLTPEQQERYLD